MPMILGGIHFCGLGTAVMPPILRDAARRPDADQRAATEGSEKRVVT